MKLSDVLYFDAGAESPVSPALDWRCDTFPALTGIAWKFLGRSYTASDKSGLSAFVDCCFDAPLLCGFNCHITVSLIKAEILRVYGSEYYEEMAVGEALDKRKRIDLMTGAKRWVDARALDGRLLNPTLEELHLRCFPGSPLETRTLTQRVQALERCLPRLVLEGLVVLRQREYTENAKNGSISVL